MKSSRRYKGGRSIAGWCKGEKVTQIAQVKVGDVLIKDSNQFKATNLTVITGVREIPKGFDYQYATTDGKPIAIPQMFTHEFELAFKDAEFFKAVKG